MKYLKVTLISILTVILSIGLLSAIAFWAAKTFYLTPEKLTSLIKQEVNERTNILFDCQSIELSYWDTWPTISIAVKEGKVKLPARTPHDSIKYVLSGTFKKATGSIQFTQFLKNKELNINNVQIYQPDIFYISGKKMLPILKKKPNRAKQKIHLQVNRIKVHEGSLSYLTKKGISWKISQAYAEAKGELGVPDKTFDLTVQIPQIYSDNNAFIPSQKLSLTLTSHCNTANKFQTVTLNDEFSLKGGKKPTYQVMPKDDCYMFTERGKDVNAEFVVNDFNVRAPVSKGQVVGRIEVYKDGVLYKTVEVISAEDVKKASRLDRLKWVSDGWSL